MIDIIAGALISSLLITILGLIIWMLRKLFAIQKGCGGCCAMIQETREHIEKIDTRLNILEGSQELIKTDIAVIKEQISQ